MVLAVFLGLAVLGLRLNWLAGLATFTPIRLGVLGMFSFKGFCRYVCPLGAVMAVGGMNRGCDWIARRPECGSPCQLCKVRCKYGAIRFVRSTRFGQPEFDLSARPLHALDLARRHRRHRGQRAGITVDIGNRLAAQKPGQKEIGNRVILDADCAIAEIGWHRRLVGVIGLAVADHDLFVEIEPGKDDLIQTTGKIGIVGHMQHDVRDSAAHRSTFPDLVLQIGIQVLIRLHETKPRRDPQRLGDQATDVDVGAAQLALVQPGIGREIVVDSEFDPAAGDDVVKVASPNRSGSWRQFRPTRPSGRRCPHRCQP